MATRERSARCANIAASPSGAADARHPFVVIHTPGPEWQPGVPLFQQRGIAGHIAHFRRLLDAGKLEVGGPFLDDAAGGMMIPAAGPSQAEIVEFANADPAVASGLLRADVRQWMIGMKK